MQSVTNDPERERSESSSLGIVVTAYNNGSTIEQCLRSLEAQTYFPKKIEVVLDTSSRDGTETVLNRLAESMNFEISRCKSVGRSEARNLGWRKNRSEVTMFADGDDVYEPYYAKRAMDCLNSGTKVGGVCLGGASLETRGLLGRFYESYGRTDSRTDTNRSDPGWAFVYRTACLEQAGGFDISLSQAEDRDLCKRVKDLGYKIGYVDGVNWFHRKPESYAGFIAKEFNSRKMRIPYEAKHRQLGSVFSSLTPLLGISVLIALGALRQFAAVGVLVLLGSLGIFLFSWIRRGRGRTRISDRFSFTFLILSGALAGSLGTVEGLLRLLFPFNPSVGTSQAN